jgi:hypothetical protein
VTVWTVASSIFLLVRLLMAVNARPSGGALRSWFLDIDPARTQQPLAVRLFMHRTGD